jgi:hypothetical protein
MYRKMVIVAMILAPLTCAARMYQWVDPHTGRTHMAGKPPGWYRSSDAHGPRVLVFENGKLVDDTARSVSVNESSTLRDDALHAAAQAAQDQTAAATSASEQTDSQTPALLRTLLGKGTSTTEGGSPASPVDDAAAVDRLKAMIGDWERRQYEEKQKIVNDAAADPQPYYDQ